VRKFRQKYYDHFSKIYDRFVALHSFDRQGSLRNYLSEKTGTQKGGKVLDICTGTASLLKHLQKKTGEDGIVVGVDFSRGMLGIAREKTASTDHVFLVQADVSHMPFKARIFDAVTCAHAFYELQGKAQDQSLREIGRLLKPGKPFLMLEHDVPNHPLIRMLFYVRLLSMGPSRAMEILKHERELLARHFTSVNKIKTPTGRSQIMICKNAY
ncbi:MAG: class I SAM-dependent methyltransferase, partial [Deltaproteobacteria bacterium]|nr:class I SAM-dependent methyltransferase [Deltaproteobacteria bacterium]